MFAIKMADFSKMKLWNQHVLISTINLDSVQNNENNEQFQHGSLGYLNLFSLEIQKHHISDPF